MLNSILCLTLLLCLNSYAIAQEYYWISFTDKGFSKKDTYAPLSPRAIKQRAKQNITFDELDKPVNPLYLKEIESKYSLSCIKQSKWLNAALFISQKRKDKSRNIVLPFVKKINIINATSIKNSSIKKLESLDPADYGNAYNQVDMIALPFLHEQNLKGQDILISVFDGGFRSVNETEAFAALFDEGRIVYTYDFARDTNFVYTASNHGTSVLSTMAANLPGQYIGTAPLASYALCITEDVGSESLLEEINWLIAAEKADSLGVNIINSSLGYTTFDDPAENHSYQDLDGNTTIITRAADIAASKGILVVSSAGNQGNKPWTYISAPSDADSILTVGAVDENGLYASFSSIGPTHNGVLKPNVTCQGKNTYVVGFNGSMYNGSGTSFSSPIIAGAAACLWQNNPTATNMDVLASIEQSAHLFHSPNVLMGNGIPNFSAANQILKSKNTTFSKDSISVYPNPVNEESIFVFYATQDGQATVQFANTMGQVLSSSTLTLTKGYNQFYLASLYSPTLFSSILISAQTFEGKTTSTLVMYPPESWDK